MKAPGSVIILAEDLSGARFVEAFLRARGVPSRAMVTRIAPEGRGSGKQWVTGHYAVEVKAHRSKAARLDGRTLIVCTDADDLSVDERLQQLADALASHRDARDEHDPLAPRADDERIALLIPRWEIETWAWHLIRGDFCTEDQKAVHWDAARSRRECHAAGALWDAHRPPVGARPACCPPSLVRADDERDRLDR